MNNIQLEKTETVLQIRRGNRDNLGIISIFFHKNISCDPPLEPSHRDGSNDGSQHMFSLRNKKIIFDLFSIPPFIWSSAEKKRTAVDQHSEILRRIQGVHILLFSLPFIIPGVSILKI